MIRPGIYQHHRGGRYRVLFTAQTPDVFEKHGELLVVFVGPDGTIGIGRESRLVHSQTQLFVVRNSSDKPMTGAAIVYVSMDHGTINVRGEEEFNERVGPGGLPRFRLVAE